MYTEDYSTQYYLLEGFLLFHSFLLCMVSFKISSFLHTISKCFLVCIIEDHNCAFTYQHFSCKLYDRKYLSALLSIIFCDQINVWNMRDTKKTWPNLPKTNSLRPSFPIYIFFAFAQTSNSLNLCLLPTPTLHLHRGLSLKSFRLNSNHVGGGWNSMREGKEQLLRREEKLYCRKLTLIPAICLLAWSWSLHPRI